jgi:hypothetical protein
MTALNVNTFVCSKCKVSKLASDFGKCKNKKNGLKSNCKDCANKSTRNSFNKNKEKHYKKHKEYIEQNKNEVTSYRRDWHFKNKYNITLTELDDLRVKQNYSCKLCGKHELDTPRKSLCVDHCHKTNKVRGLLCESCNQALGLFYDNINTIEKAAKYLREHDQS